MPYDGEVEKFKIATTVEPPRASKITPEAREVLIEARRLLAAGWVQGAERTTYTELITVAEPVKVRVKVKKPVFFGLLQLERTEIIEQLQSKTVKVEHELFCVVGALARAAGGTSTGLFVNAAERLIQLGRIKLNIPSWNDSPGRSQQQVLDLFDQVLAQ